MTDYHNGKEALRRMMEAVSEHRLCDECEYVEIEMAGVQQVAAYVAELEAQVAEARVFLDSIMRDPEGRSRADDQDVYDWLVRTAPKEQS